MCKCVLTLAIIYKAISGYSTYISIKTIKGSYRVWLTAGHSRMKKLRMPSGALLNEKIDWFSSFMIAIYFNNF